MSPTVQTLLIVFIVLVLCAGVGYFMGKMLGLKKALTLFFFLWLAYCIYHMFVGMSHGYSFISELPFLALNFGLPALIAWIILKKASSLK